MSEDDKIKLFVCNHTDPERRGCVSLSIDGHRFDLTIDETVILSEYLERAILFEVRAMQLRKDTEDVRDRADTGEMLKALTGQEEDMTNMETCDRCGTEFIVEEGTLSLDEIRPEDGSFETVPSGIHCLCDACTAAFRRFMEEGRYRNADGIPISGWEAIEDARERTRAYAVRFGVRFVNVPGVDPDSAIRAASEYYKMIYGFNPGPEDVISCELYESGNMEEDE